MLYGAIQAALLSIQIGDGRITYRKDFEKCNLMIASAWETDALSAT